MTEQFANNASSTLSSSINASVTTITVANGSAFSSSGTFRIVVESEIMLVSARSGNNLTVTRGAEGTSATSHSSGTTVTQIITAGALAQLKSDASIARTVSAVKTSNYTLSSADDIVVYSTSGGPFTITLPGNPSTGESHVITDVGGSVTTSQLTVSGNGKNIATRTGSLAASDNINIPYDSVTYVYNGTFWSVSGSKSITGVLRTGTGNPNSGPIFVQGNNTAALTATTSSAVTAGNLLLVMLQTEGASIGTPSDNLGTSYSLLTSVTGGSLNAGVWVGIAPSSGVVTVTGTQTATFQRTTVCEFKNVTTTLDSSSIGNGVGSTNVNVVTTSSIVIGLVAFFHSSVTFTQGTGLTANVTGTGADATFVESGVPTLTGTFTVSYGQNFGSFATSLLFGIVLRASNSASIQSIGTDGDFYIDTLNKRLYGPRTNGVYTAIGVLT